MESIGSAAILLHIGIFVIVIATLLAQYHDRPFWRGSRVKPPKPVARAMTTLGLFFMFHFVLFLIQGHGAAPRFWDSGFVLVSHGSIVKVITRAEYFRLKAEELRLFATGWMFFYFVLAAYGWLPQSRQSPNKSLSPEMR